MNIFVRYKNIFQLLYCYSCTNFFSESIAVAWEVTIRGLKSSSSEYWINPNIDQTFLFRLWFLGW
jgi:hypothetical protein